MEEIKVGEYVRTFDGRIDKFKGYTPERTFACCKNGVYLKSNITKHSFNIIDLIEVGDYVNGYKVLEKIKSNIRENGIHILIFRTHSSETWETFFEDEIESIVTKEQFESMKYEVK